MPEVGIGTWRYTGGAGPLRVALEHGATLIDTAESYGTEDVVGQAIAGQRDRTFIATKALPRHFRRRDLLAAADASLQRLRIDRIDLYQLHWPNDTIPISETMSAMEELVDAGKIRFIGVSNFSISDLRKAEAALTRHKIVCNQLRYSLIERTIEGGLLQYCQANNITVMAFSPLGQGIAHIQASDNGGVLTHIAKARAKTPAQVALNWLLTKDNVIVIPKASAPNHIIENCGASDWRLTADECRQLENGIRCKRRGRIESFIRRSARHAYQLFGREV